jgi:hypothetical protein
MMKSLRYLVMPRGTRCKYAIAEAIFVFGDYRDGVNTRVCEWNLFVEIISKKESYYEYAIFLKMAVGVKSGRLRINRS